jgi:hypothetical protein
VAGIYSLLYLINGSSPPASGLPLERHKEFFKHFNKKKAEAK